MNAVLIATVIKYFACSALICMIMSMYTGNKMISGNKKTRKQVENTEEEE